MCFKSCFSTFSNICGSFSNSLYSFTMHCLCGSTACVCENFCRCCPIRCRCRCLQCSELRRQQGGVYCDHCNGFIPLVMCRHIHEWTRTGIYPNLDFLPKIPSQASCSESDEGAKMTRSVPEATSNTPTESYSDESLIFQMDDIDDDSSEASTNIPIHLRTSFSGRPQVSSNVTVNDISFRRNRPQLTESHDTGIQSLHHPTLPILELTESRVSEMPILQHHRFSQISNDRDFSRPNLDEIPGILPISECTELDVSGMPMPHDLSEYSQDTNTDFSRPRSSYFIEAPIFCEATANVSKRTVSPISEMQIPHDLPGCSRYSPKESASISEKSQMTDYVWCKIPSPSNEYVSERKESYIREIPVLEELPGCSGYNINKNIAKFEEAQQIVDASSMTSSPSHGYSSETLPSLPSTPSSYESSSSHFLVSARSPTRRLSASAPSTYHIPQPLSELKSSVTQNTSETVPTSGLSQLETLTITDSTDKTRTMSESSSSIETLPSDVANGTGNINEHSEFSAICETSALLNNISVNNTQIQSESMKQSTSQISPSANRPKLSSPEMSKAVKLRKSSESSIETLSRDPTNETSEDEQSTDTSPKKDN